MFSTSLNFATNNKIYKKGLEAKMFQVLFSFYAYFNSGIIFSDTISKP